MMVASDLSDVSFNLAGNESLAPDSRMYFPSPVNAVSVSSRVCPEAIVVTVLTGVIVSVASSADESSVNAAMEVNETARIANTITSVI